MTPLACTFCARDAGRRAEGFCCLRCQRPLVACGQCADAIRARRVHPDTPMPMETFVASMRIALELHHEHSGACEAVAVETEVRP